MTQPIEPGTVVWVSEAERTHRRSWINFPCRVLTRPSPPDLDEEYLQPLHPRPDGYGHSPFFWKRDNLTTICPHPHFN